MMNADIEQDLHELSPLQRFWRRCYLRWETWFIEGRRSARGAYPSESKFWKYMGVTNAVGNTWMEGRNGMSLKSCVEVALRFWDIGSKGGIFGSIDAEELFKVNGYDPVVPVRDERLRAIVVRYWDNLDDEDKQKLANFAEDLANEPPTAPRNPGPANKRRVSHGTTQDLADAESLRQREGVLAGIQPDEE